MSKKVLNLKPTNLYEEASRRYQELLKMKMEMEASIEKAPPGKIHIIRSNKRTQFYLRTEKTDRMGEYVSKSNASKLKTYIQKTYDARIVKYLDQELKILESFLRKSSCFFEGMSQIQANHFIKGELSILPSYPIKRIQQIYSSYPEEAKKYINPIDMSDEDKPLFSSSYTGGHLTYDAMKYMFPKIFKAADIYLANGILHIRARHESFEGSKYTSARITTRIIAG